MERTKVNEIEEPLEKVRKMIEKDGAKGWNMAKETLMHQETDNAQLKQALAYLTLIPDFFRPAVVTYCCKAVGGDPEVTIPTSASLILFAKAIGMHDDIIDKVKKRKNHLTAFGKFGEGIVLVLSDILLFKGFTLLRKNLEIGVSPTALSKILETIDSIWFEQSESEIFEQQSRNNINIPPEKCLAKITKRASEFEVITRIGAILGGGSERDVRSFAFYGRSMGTASLLRDELIDMLEFSILKHRIKRESMPLPLVYALQSAKARSRLIPLISNNRTLKISELLEISKLVDMTGGMDYTADLIKENVKKACSSIKKFHKKEELSLIAKSLQIGADEWKLVLETM